MSLLSCFRMVLETLQFRINLIHSSGIMSRYCGIFHDGPATRPSADARRKLQTVVVGRQKKTGINRRCGGAGRDIATCEGPPYKSLVLFGDGLISTAVVSII
jgi:hypothetical protein